MCGLIGEFNTKTSKSQKGKDANDFVMNQYQDQYTRGTRGFGIIRINEKGKIETDRATQETKFLIDLTLKKAPMILAHHRQPTSTDNKMRQTHPMFVSNKILKKDYLFMHNGVVTGITDIKKKHEELGFKYTTECEPTYTGESIKWNDTETLAIEMVLFLEGKTKEIETTNRAAFLIVQINKKTQKAEKVYFGQHQNGDLNMDKKSGTMKISSEGIGEQVEGEKLFSFNIGDNKMKLSNIDLIYKEEEKIVTKTETEKSNYTGNNLLTNIKSKKDKDEVEIENMRSWALQMDMENGGTGETDDVDDKYVDRIRTDFSDKIIAGGTSLEIIEKTYAEMEDQIDKASEIIREFREKIMLDKYTTKGKLLNKLAKIADAMLAIVDEGEIEFDTIREQEIEEEEDAIEDAGIEEAYSRYGYDTNKVRAGYKLSEHGFRGHISKYGHDGVNDF